MMNIIWIPVAASVGLPSVQLPVYSVS